MRNIHNRGEILIDKVHAKAESTIVQTTKKIRDNGLILSSNRMKIGNIKACTFKFEFVHC